MLRIEELIIDNFDDFYSLLSMRGSADREYYFWKYFKQPYSDFPKGYIAYIDSEAVGCIGMSQRRIILFGGEFRDAIWFSDWYVASTSRTFGVGRKLMEKVYNSYDAVLGITNPMKAQRIANEIGYNLNMQTTFLRVQNIHSIFNVLGKEGKVKRAIKALIPNILLATPRIRKVKIRQISESHEIPGALLKSNSKVSFERNGSIYEYMFTMPISYRRDWFIAEHLDFNILMSLDFEKERSVLKVFDHDLPIESIWSYIKYVKLIRQISLKYRCDFFETYDSANFKNRKFLNLIFALRQPLQFKILEGCFVLERVSIIDKESSWVDY